MTRELREGFPCQNAFTCHEISKTESAACSTQVHNERMQGGHNSPGAKSLRGCRKVPTMSQVLYSTQYICFRKNSGSNTGAPNLLLATGAI